MKNIKIDLQLDKEEKEILEAYEQKEFISIFSEEEKQKLINGAALTMNKNRNINIRLSSKDLLKLKSKASERGLPYQTLVASLIHQYNEGKIKPEL